MANYVANAVDWYINKLNQAHLVPTNMAALIRDIASKQLGDENFVPRKLTVDNFTDEELDAIHRLSYDTEKNKYGPITDYDKLGVKGNFGYGSRTQGASEYLSPLRIVSTTLGMAGLKDDKKTGEKAIVDTYDFNKDRTSYAEDPEGGIVGANGKHYKDVEEYKKDLSIPVKGRDDTLYGKVRRTAGIFGHNDSDPDKNKIKAYLPIDEIRNRLGNRVGTLDIHRSGSKKDFAIRTALAGGLTSGLFGAGLGALSGAIKLLKKENRKKWLSVMLKNIAAWSLISSAAGAAGGGYLAHKAYDSLDGNSRSKKPVEKNASAYSRKRKTGSRERINRLIDVISYAAPIGLLVGLPMLVARKASNLASRMTDAKTDVGGMINIDKAPPEDSWQYFMQEPPVT